MKKIYRWKFLREVDGKIKSDSGDCTWKMGTWKNHKGNLSMCSAGFHCSKQVYQAFSFVRGEILAKVECSGKSEVQDDKEVYEKMKIVKAYKWQKKDSVALAIFAAELCIENFEKLYPNDKRPREAVEAAKKWLRYPTQKNKDASESAAESARSAAWSAAWSAAESAAWSAAWSAAESARSAAESARSAAESAAESAAWSAAWSAAESAIVEKISVWMDERVKKLEVYKK